MNKLKDNRKRGDRPLQKEREPEMEGSGGRGEGVKDRIKMCYVHLPTPRDECNQCVPRTHTNEEKEGRLLTKRKNNTIFKHYKKITCPLFEKFLFLNSTSNRTDTARVSS